MMALIIDAWLERNEPFIRFIDADTASELLVIGGRLLARMPETGELCPDELSHDRYQEAENLLTRLNGGIPY
ncbi:MAG: hypothetical protein ACYC2R_15540 [Burkholderiales bacterium]